MTKQWETPAKTSEIVLIPGCFPMRWTNALADIIGPVRRRKLISGLRPVHDKLHTFSLTARSCAPGAQGRRAVVHAGAFVTPDQIRTMPDRYSDRHAALAACSRPVGQSRLHRGDRGPGRVIHGARRGAASRTQAMARESCLDVDIARAPSSGNSRGAVHPVPADRCRAHPTRRTA